MKNSLPSSKRKKIAVIGTVGLPANYGGFETLIEFITQKLNSNFDFTVYCSAKTYENKKPTHNNCDLEYINLNANGIQSVFYDMKSILHALKYADILLILGVSGCTILPVIRFFCKKKIIVNIDGLEWKRAKWNRFAKWFLRFSEKCAVKAADGIIADNKVIKDYVIKTYNKQAHLISYGGNHCSKEKISSTTLEKYHFLRIKYAFKVCRIEPENNIEMILKAFSEYPAVPLVLVGNWENSEFGKKLRNKYLKFNNLYLLDPIYDQKVLNQLRSNCMVYIHGHSAGGTNPSLVEAMSLGLSIIAFGIDYNKETTKDKAVYFNSAQELTSIIKQLEHSKLCEIGKSMKIIANKNYTWEQVSNQYQQLMQ